MYFRYIYLASSSSAVCGAIHPVSASTHSHSGRQNPRASSSASSNLAYAVDAQSRHSSRLHSLGVSRDCMRSLHARLSYALQRCLLQCRTYTSTLVGILCICVFCVVLCVPAYIYPSVKPHVYSNESVVVNKTVTYRVLYHYQVEQSDLNNRTNNTVFKVTFYTQAILAKFIPCILLVTFSSLLIHSLVVINQNNKVNMRLF